MAKVLAIARYHQYRGSFTNNKNVWEAIKQMLADDPDVEQDEISDKDMEDILVIQDDRGKIRGEMASGAIKQFTNTTYAHLCTILRRDGKVAFHDAENFMPIFGVWLGEMNQIYRETDDDSGTSE